MAAYRYWRIAVTRSRYAGTVIDGARDIRFANVSFLSAAYALSPRMSDLDTPAPLVATASSIYAPGFEPWRAFDSGLGDNSRFISGNALLPEQWLQIDFGTAYDFVAVSLAPDSAGNAYAPVDLRVLASDTGFFAGEETTLLAVTDLADWVPSTDRQLQWAPFDAVTAAILPGPLSVGSGRTPTDFSEPHVALVPGALSATKPLAFGPGRISGTLKVLTAPAAREVRLHDRFTGQLLRTTTSAPDGTYTFSRLQLDRPYIVVGLDNTGQPSMYNAAVADMVEAGP